MPAPGLALGWTVYRLPRRGHAAEECQDAAAGDGERGRFAIADGASEGAQTGLWARLLVEAFVGAEGGIGAWANWLSGARDRFADAVRPVAEVPWFLDAALRQGAFATFLGLAVDECGWDALAVGDSCLFQVRDNALAQVFPVGRAADFGNTPPLVGSRGAVGLNCVRRRGDWRGGDRLWLMTDALAQWFLGQAEVAARPWVVLDRLLADGPSAFTGWIEDLRGLRRLRNDDVTLLAVSL